jgi:hypothetical protein
VDAIVLFARYYFGVVIALRIGLVGIPEHLPGAKLNAQLAALAALYEDEDLPSRQAYAFFVDRFSGKDFHDAPRRILALQHKIFSLLLKGQGQVTKLGRLPASRRRLPTGSRLPRHYSPKL